MGECNFVLAIFCRNVILNLQKTTIKEFHQEFLVKFFESRTRIRVVLVDMSISSSSNISNVFVVQFSHLIHISTILKLCGGNYQKTILNSCQIRCCLDRIHINLIWKTRKRKIVFDIFLKTKFSKRDAKTMNCLNCFWQIKFNIVFFSPSITWFVCLFTNFILKVFSLSVCLLIVKQIRFFLQKTSFLVFEFTNRTKKISIFVLFCLKYKNAQWIIITRMQCFPTK